MTPMPNRFASLRIAAVLAGLLAFAWPCNAGAGGVETESESPGTTFAECGTLHVTAGPGGITCTSLEIHIGGVYQLDQHGGFGDGAEVCVIGTVGTCSGSGCGSGSLGCVTVTSIDAAVPITGLDGTVMTMGECGTVLESAATCFVFEIDSGEVYSVLLPAGEVYYAGERLHVTGDLVACTGMCAPADGCVFNPQFSGCPVAGDLNGDGLVNGMDLALLLGAWGSCTGCAADLDGSGSVNGMDLAILLGQWG